MALTLNKKLFESARKVRLHAHAPYSRFKVGAALVDEKGRIHVGCNVENSSYGGTICAERAAITAMIAAGGKWVREIAIVTDTPKGCPPCGMCRQVLREFVSPKKDIKIHIATTKVIEKTTTISELLPQSFDADFLPK